MSPVETGDELAALLKGPLVRRIELRIAIRNALTAGISTSEIQGEVSRITVNAKKETLQCPVCRSFFEPGEQP